MRQKILPITTVITLRMFLVWIWVTFTFTESTNTVTFSRVTVGLLLRICLILSIYGQACRSFAIEGSVPETDNFKKCLFRLLHFTEKLISGRLLNPYFFIWFSTCWMLIVYWYLLSKKFEDLILITVLHSCFLCLVHFSNRSFIASMMARKHSVSATLNSNRDLVKSR